MAHVGLQRVIAVAHAEVLGTCDARLRGTCLSQAGRECPVSPQMCQGRTLGQRRPRGDIPSVLDAASVPLVHRIPARTSLASEELRGLKEVWTGRSLQAVPSRQHAVPFVTCTGLAMLCPHAEARSYFCLDNAHVDRRGLCGSQPFLEDRSACTVQLWGDDHRPYQALKEAQGKKCAGWPLEGIRSDGLGRLLGERACLGHQCLFG